MPAPLRPPGPDQPVVLTIPDPGQWCGGGQPEQAGQRDGGLRADQFGHRARCDEAQGLGGEQPGLGHPQGPTPQVILAGLADRGGYD